MTYKKIENNKIKTLNLDEINKKQKTTISTKDALNDVDSYCDEEFKNYTKDIISKYRLNKSHAECYIVNHGTTKSTCNNCKSRQICLNINKEESNKYITEVDIKNDFHIVENNDLPDDEEEKLLFIKDNSYDSGFRCEIGFYCGIKNKEGNPIFDNAEHGFILDDVYAWQEINMPI